MSACSFVWRLSLIRLASLVSVESGDAGSIDEGGGAVS